MSLVGFALRARHACAEPRLPRARETGIPPNPATRFRAMIRDRIEWKSRKAASRSDVYARVRRDRQRERDFLNSNGKQTWNNREMFVSFELPLLLSIEI